MRLIYTNMYLFAYGQPTAERGTEAHHLGYERPEGQVLLEDHAAHDGLHLRNARPCNTHNLTTQPFIVRINLSRQYAYINATNESCGNTGKPS